VFGLDMMVFKGGVMFLVSLMLFLMV
jgi:hypothetical protein